MHVSAVYLGIGFCVVEAGASGTATQRRRFHPVLAAPLGCMTCGTRCVIALAERQLIAIRRTPPSLFFLSAAIPDAFSSIPLFDDLRCSIAGAGQSLFLVVGPRHLADVS